MRKTAISKTFLYKNRFIIGYVLLGVAFFAPLFTLPLFAQTDLSRAEMDSAIIANNLNFDSVLNGNLLDLPYHLLQKVSIALFGLTPYAIKLPSIIIATPLALLIILLLNRWFKNNVSLLASFLVVLSTPFLFLAGSGTPLIMLLFWPTLFLWLGSKIQGEDKPNPTYCLLFAIALLVSVFTPYMIYFAIFCVIFVLSQPHLRFTIKHLPKFHLILACVFIAVGLLILGTNIIAHPTTIMSLFFAENFILSDFISNISTGLATALSWAVTLENVFLSPLIALPILTLALIGLFSTTKGFFASRNSIASLLLVFALVITGFNPKAIIFILLPLAILVAHGLKYILEKWYGLFPENPYARISALIPLTLFFSLTLIPGLLQYIYGYRYSPNITNEFTSDLSIIHNNLSSETLLIQDDTYEFYKILENSTNLTITSTLQDLETTPDAISVLGKPENTPENYTLSRIITSSKTNNSDRIYLYVHKGE